MQGRPASFPVNGSAKLPAWGHSTFQLLSVNTEGRLMLPIHHSDSIVCNTLIPLAATYCTRQQLVPAVQRSALELGESTLSITVSMRGMRLSSNYAKRAGMFRSGSKHRESYVCRRLMVFCVFIHLRNWQWENFFEGCT